MSHHSPTVLASPSDRILKNPAALLVKQFTEGAFVVKNVSQIPKVVREPALGGSSAQVSRATLSTESSLLRSGPS